MSNSSLISYTKLSPNHSGKRTKKIDTVTIHCMAGQLSVESCGSLFARSSRQASSNYGIGPDGRIALYVDEGNRSWCTSSNANDQRAVTIEVASDATHPYAVNSKAYDALLDLVTDICKRNGIKKLVWSTSKSNRVGHLNGCNMTVHRDYAAKACPGDYLYNLQDEIAAEVNRQLGSSSSTPSTGETTGGTADIKVGDVVEFTGTKHYVSATATSASSCKPGKAKVTAIAKGKAHPYHLKAISGGGSTVYGWVNAADISTGSTGTATSYRVRTTADVLNIRKGPGTNYGVAGQIKGKGIYRTMIFLPCATSLVSYSMIFKSLFANDGLVNRVLSTVGIPTVDWFQNAWAARWVIVIALIWRWTGYNMVFYLAGLQNIDYSIYEAARIDGASPIQQFIHLTIPLLKPTILLTAIMSTSGTLQLFDESVNLTAGGPGKATMTLTHYIYNISFVETPKFNYAAALSVFILVVVAVLSAIQMKVGDKRD